MQMGKRFGVLGCWAWVLLMGAPALAEEAELEFLDPLTGETPLPETDIRFDHHYRNQPSGSEHSLQVGVEYAPVTWFSFELNVPVAFRDPDDGPSVSNLDNAEIELKFAPFVFLERGLAFGGGLEVEFPTGDESKEIGSNRELEVEPFLSAGWINGDLQTTGILQFGIPMNQSEEEAEEVDLEIGFNLAFIYELTPEFAPLLEFDGKGVAKGSDNKTAVHATLGFISAPFETEDLNLGFGISAPLTSDEDFDVRTIFSIFYEF